MKIVAAYLCGRRQVELREDALLPKRNEVLVRTAACGICRGDLRRFDSGPPRPEKWGHEPVGQVVACGDGTEVLREGDWVAGTIHGSFATHFVALESELHRVPAELRELGCLAEPLKCVTTVVRTAAPDFGDVVVVVGCGFMGLSAVAGLSGGWPRDLVAVDPIQERRLLAKDLGATLAIDPSGKALREAVQQLTDGGGADVAIEFTGALEAPAVAARLLRPRGRLVLGGGQSAHENIYGTACTLHHVPPAFSADERDDYRRAIAAMAQGRFPLPRLVSHRFKLSQIQQAFDVAIASGTGYLKGIVVNDIG